VQRVQGLKKKASESNKNYSLLATKFNPRTTNYIIYTISISDKHITNQYTNIKALFNKKHQKSQISWNKSKNKHTLIEVLLILNFNFEKTCIYGSFKCEVNVAYPRRFGGDFVVNLNK